MKITFNITKKVFIGFAVLFNLLSFFSCEIGLGQSVDTDAPNGSITSPGVDAIIRDVFAIKGTWTDDGSVSEVAISLKNTSSGKTATYLANIQSNGSWYCEINPDDSGQPLVDGSYLATVVLKDDGGHTTTLTRSYTIDNTAPLMVITRPSTLAGAESKDSYGQTFTLQGQAVDTSDVSKVVVNVYSDEACTSLLKTVTLTNVPATMELDVAAYGSEDYTAIYGSSGKENGTQTRYCTFTAYDGAASYPLDGNGSSDGNSTTTYYLYDDISDLISDYKVTNIYKMLNGTYSGSESNKVAVEDSLADFAAQEGANKGSFTLNPNNNPTFNVSGINYISSDSGEFDNSNSNYIVTTGTTKLTLLISPGLDGISIKPETLGVYLSQCDSSGNALYDKDSSNVIWLVPIGEYGTYSAKVGTSYKITTNTIGVDLGLSTGTGYRICVVGEDKKGNSIKEEIDDNNTSKIFAFFLGASGNMIDLTLSSTPEYVSTLEAANTANKILSVTLNYTYSDSSSPLYIWKSFTGADSMVNVGQTVSGETSYTDSIQASDLLSNNMPTAVYYKLTSDTAGTSYSYTKSVKINYDNEVPVLGTTNCPGTAETALSSFSFSGSASDTGSGLAAVYINITNKDYVGTETSYRTTGDLKATGTDSWTYKISKSDIESGGDLYDCGVFSTEGYKTVTVYAVDNVGLKSELYKNTEWIYDSSAPEFTISSYISADDDGAYTGSGTSISTSTSGSASFNTGKAFKLTGTASDNFGIALISVTQSVTLNDETTTVTLDSDTEGGIVYDSADGSWYIKDLPRSSDGSGVSLPDSGTLATYTYTFTIKDSGGTSGSVKTLTVVIDREAPVITITSPDSADSSNANQTPDYSAFGEGSLSGDAYTFRGTASDGEGLGMQYYSYVITDSATAPSKSAVDSDGNSIWTKKSKTSSGNWSFPLSLGSGTSGTEDETIYEGTHYLHVYAVDKANNESDIITVPFCVDQAAPVLAVMMETKASETDSDYIPLTNLSSYDIADAASFRFVIYASDTNGISSVSAINSLDNSVIALTKTENENVWTSADISTEGSYTILITAEDISGNGLTGDSAVNGRKSTITRTVVFDKTAPSIDSVKINNEDITSSTDNSTKWYSANTVTVLVTAGDNASGVSAVQYSTDNENWQDFLISSGSYRANVEFAEEGSQLLYIRAADVIGNVSKGFKTVDSEGAAIDGIVIKIDTSAPELETLWYQTGDAMSEASGTVYVSGIEQKDLTVYGRISDGDSGISDLTFKMNGSDVTPTELKYSRTVSTTNEAGENTADWITGAEEAASVEDGAFAALTAFTDTTTIKTWKATFAAADVGSGKFVASASNGAGASYSLPAFTISVDSKAPSHSNIKVETLNTAYSVYQPDTSLYNYYLNNEEQTFTISGIATDDKGISKVAISVESYSDEVSTSGEWSFASIDLSSVTASSTTATITAYDVAGNKQEESLTLNIDKTPPLAKHWADKNNKDIYFRIGSSNNEKSASTTASSGYVNDADDDWDTSLDEDVGGKYSAGTYGNSSTIEIRGYFEEVSSGLKMIYYKIFSSAPTAAEISALETGYKSLPNYFSPLTSEKTRRVVYSDSSDTKKSINVPSNFDSTISGFDNEKNYLVLVAVDNVGNVKADTLSGYSVNQSASDSDSTSKWNGTDSSGNGLEYYAINVDSVVPQISDTVYSNKSTKDDKSLDGTVYSNKKEASGNYISLYGLATDSASGIYSIVFTVNGKTISSDSTAYGSLTLTKSGKVTLGGKEYSLSENQAYWNVVINPSAFAGVDSGSISIYAKVTDNAGSGNSNTVSVATVTIDETAPTVTLDSPTDADSDSDGIQINGKISLTGTVNDVNTLPSSSVSAVQYSTDQTKWTDADSTLMSDFAVSGSYSYKVTGFDTTKLSDGTYYLRVAAKDVAGNTGYSNIVTVKVAQDSDRPVVTFTNLEIGEENASATDTSSETVSYMSSSKYVWLKNTTTLTGIVTDDDGISSMSYSTDNSSWTALSLNNSSWSITLSEGSSVVYFKITDTAGETFTSQTSPSSVLKTPKLADGTYTISGGIPVYLKVDKTAPVTRNLRYSYFDESLETPAYTAYAGELASVGGKRTKVQLNLDAGDENDIESLELSLTVTENETSSTLSYQGSQQADSAKESDGKYYSNWTITDIDVSNLPTGTSYASLTVTDKAGLSKTETVVIVVDNTYSTVSVKSPSSSSTVSGEVSAYGTLTETASLYYSVSPSASSPDSVGTVSSWLDGEGNSNALTAIAVEGWTQVEDAGLSWTVNFNNVTDGSASGTNTKSLNKYIIDYGIAAKDSSSSATDAIVSTFETYVTLYLHLKTVDSVGNEFILSYPIVVDPQGDRPSVYYSYPSENAVTLGGRVSIYGTATDTKGTNIGVDSVWVQIKSTTHGAAEDTDTYGTSPVYDAASDSVTMTLKKEDLDYMASKGYSVYKMSAYDASTGATNIAWESGISSLESGESAGDYGALAALSGAAWNITINGSSEFDPPTGISSNPIAIRVIARDGDGKFSLKADRYVSFDADTPVISDLYLVQAADGKITTSSTASKAYSQDMYVKELWYLTGTATDKDKIAELTIGSAILIKDGSVESAWSDRVTLSADKTSAQFKYPLASSSGVGNLSFTVSATDAAEGTTHTGKEEISINYDNTPPVLAENTSSAFNISGDICQSNSWYTFGSAAYEAAASDGTAQSGFAYTAFFFQRTYTSSDNQTVNNIYDILQAKSSAVISLGSGSIPALGQEAASASDNTIVSDSGLYWYKKTISDISGNTFTVSNTDGIRVNALMKIDGALYLITAVNGTSVTVGDTLSDGIESGYVAIAGIVDNTTPESAPSVGDIQSDGYYENPNRDDGDRMIESVDKSGTSWTWEANVCSRNIADGPITLHYVVFDKAGNCTAGSVGGTVSNNKPRIAGAIVKTDYNGNGNVTDDGETVNTYAAAESYEEYYTGGSGSADDPYVYDPDSKVKNKNAKNPLKTSVTYGEENAPVAALRGYTLIQPEIVGGNGALYYSYKVTNGDTEKSGRNSTAFISQGSTDYTAVTGDINVQLGDLLAFGDTEDSNTGIPFEFTIWDSTEGLSAFTSSQKATLTMYFAVQAASVGTPSASITPFYWKSLTDNSIYSSSGAESFSDLKGHIELEDDWKNAGGYDSNTSGTQYDSDPKVSGKITLAGSAGDTKLIAKITASIFGQSYEVATYSASTGLLASNYAEADFATNGFWFELESSQAVTSSGHTAPWKLHIDTEKLSAINSDLTSVTAIDQAVTMTVTNYGKPAASTTNGSLVSIDGSTKYSADLTYTDAKSNTPGSTQTTGTAATAYYRMDIVPYIAGVKTSLSSLKKSKSSVYDRTALGHYPTASDSKVYLYGFNLTGGSLKDKTSESVSLTQVTPGTSYNWYSSNYFKYSSAYEADVSAFTSGNVYVSVNEISSLNNVNSNNAKGLYASTSSTSGEYALYSNYYNRQPNNDSNNLLTDDVVLDVWAFDSDAVVPISGKIEQPHMAIDPKTGQIGFAFVNGPLYFSMAGSTENSKKTSYDYWMGSYDFFTSVGFAYDSLGYTYGVAAGGDINSSSADKFQFMTSRWGMASRAQNGSYSSSNSLRLESIGIKGTKSNTSDSTYYFDKQRIKSPSITTSVHDKYTNVYLAYYDAMNDEIRFKAGSTNSTSITNFDSFTDYDTSGSPYSYRHAKVSMIAGNGTSYGAGSYVSLGVVPGSTRTSDVVVVVWYDETSRVLRYSYNTSPLTDRNGTTDRSGWSTPITIFSGDMVNAGEYCQLAVDANGGIHIAAYDGTNCDLVYAYLSDYAASPSTCIVDASGVIGSNITIDVALDSNSNAIPRIGYYATSCIRPKLAYLVNTSAAAPAGSVDEVFTGAWECTVVPTGSSVNMQSNQYNKINVGVWKDSDTGIVTNSTSGTSSYTNTPNSYNSTSYGFVYGNGTDNAVLGYAIKVNSASDAIETAQMQ